MPRARPSHFFLPSKSLSADVGLGMRPIALGMRPMGLGNETNGQGSETSLGHHGLEETVATCIRWLQPGSDFAFPIPLAIRPLFCSICSLHGHIPRTRPLPRLARTKPTLLICLTFVVAVVVAVAVVLMDGRRTTQAQRGDAKSLQHLVVAAKSSAGGFSTTVKTNRSRVQTNGLAGWDQ